MICYSVYMKMKVVPGFALRYWLLQVIELWWQLLLHVERAKEHHDCIPEILIVNDKILLLMAPSSLCLSIVEVFFHTGGRFTHKDCVLDPREVPTS